MSLLYKKCIYFFSIVLFVSGTFISAEYLIYKKTDTGFVPLKDERVEDEQEHRAIYDILMRYQFPMSTNPNVTLSVSEIDGLLKSEHSFIAQKLKELDPQLRIAFIPTTFYELFALYDYYKSNDMHFVPTCRYNTWHDFNANFNWDTVAWHLRIQNQLFNFFIQHNGMESIDTNALLSNNDAQQLVTIFINTLNAFYQEKEKLPSRIDKQRCEGSSFLIFFSLYDTSIIEKALDIEYEAYHSNHDVLFRGTHLKHKTCIDLTLKKENNDFTPVALSYGKSLFSGFFYDSFSGKAKSAMPYKFITEGAHPNPYVKTGESLLGYALLIKKDPFLKKESESKKLFIIPLTSTLAQLASKGEYFHPRLYTCLDENYDAHLYTPDKHLATNFLGNQEEYDTLFSQFLVQNIRILKNDTNLKNEEVIQNQLKPFFDKYPYYFQMRSLAHSTKK